MKKIIIAIDGHSSTGKSTLAKMLSKNLGYKHINTGSMYRAVTLHAIRNNWVSGDLESYSVNENLIIDSLDSLKFDFVFSQNYGYCLHLNGKNIEKDIKNPLVSQYVSLISTYYLIRKKIVSIQQKIGLDKGVVMEGRDIGSVVFPDAELKLFITASYSVRAKRRYEELLNIGIETTLEDVLINIQMRDKVDSNRKNSPLVQVKDAILIDNTFLDIQEQFDYVIRLLKEKKHLS